MKNTLNKTKTCLTAVGIAIAFGLTSNASAQSVGDPWTGAIPGANYHFSGDDLLKDIRSLLNNGKIDEAVSLARRNVDGFERDTRSGKTSKLRYDAYNALCISLTAQKSYDDAKKACDTAVEDTPGRWMAYNSRGNLNMKMGNFSEALNDYNLALGNAPDSSNVRSILQHNVQLAQSKR